MQRKHIFVLTVIVGLLLAACGGSNSGAEPGDVTFDVELIEIKGGTDGIPAPDVDPTSLSQGYRFTPPGEFDADNPAKWQVSTYMFSPASMSVIADDSVTLRFFGVNGDDHDVRVEAPDGSNAVDTFIVQRGREVQVSFDADQQGHYKIFCGIHGPTMTADILSIG